jgi:hypothetical protein
MDTAAEIDAYLDHKRHEREKVYADAASTSLLMNGVQFLCTHFYHLLDWYSRLYLKMFFRPSQSRPMGKTYADAIDTYHAIWVVITFACYLVGWYLLHSTDPSLAVTWCWVIPVAICVYRIFESYAALLEMYFRDSESRHHQFRVLLHSFLHYLSTGFSFALFYVLTDRFFATFTSEGDDGKMESSFRELFDPIFQSFLTVVAFSGNDEPQNWIGKLLILIEMFIGFILATFIFLNITQVWLGKGESSK